ncbi:MAG TPA: lactonase family protein [Terracidiphilus sp.]|nr:lactonase family protein [Terracidiphilus sp.]
MTIRSRRDFLKTASAATLLTAYAPGFAQTGRQRVFVASGSPNGILAFDWDGATGTLTEVGVAARIPTVDWITFSPRHEYLFAACELDSFNGKPTGEVASFSVRGGMLHPLSARNSASKGTCQVALDHTGSVLMSADYGGGSVAAFKVSEGRLSEAVWTTHYTFHGPDRERQESAHAHFCSYSPDNRFAYVNDLGGDMIHIYRLDAARPQLTPAGAYHGLPGSGPRTLHFHPNGHTAYCMYELASTVEVLEWRKTDGNFSLVKRFDLLQKGYKGISRGCDTVITRDGRFVYFANRDDDFLYSFKADPKSGALTPMKRSSCGGRIPRYFTLDPTERWMLVANQDSSWVSIFARNPQTGELASQGRNIAAPTPMCIVFL